jgi:ribosomal protein S18 acetylase RimI-like enzyme
MRATEGEDTELPCRRLLLPVELTVRGCTEEDLPKLEWFGMFSEHREILAEAFLRHRRGDNPMLVLALRDFPVGQVWVDLEKKREASTGVLWALRVFPLFQGMGLGAVLVEEAEALLCRRGYAVAEIGVERHNTRALRLYERLGYRLVGEACEEYSYTRPDGVHINALADQWLLQRALEPT